MGDPRNPSGIPHHFAPLQETKIQPQTLNLQESPGFPRSGSFFPAHPPPEPLLPLLHTVYGSLCLHFLQLHPHVFKSQLFDRKNLRGGPFDFLDDSSPPKFGHFAKIVRQKKGHDFVTSRCSSWRRPERYIGGGSVCGSKNDKQRAPEIKFVKAPP